MEHVSRLREEEKIAELFFNKCLTPNNFSSRGYESKFADIHLSEIYYCKCILMQRAIRVSHR
jgi:hypothetical protein